MQFKRKPRINNNVDEIVNINKNVLIYSSHLSIKIIESRIIAKIIGIILNKLSSPLNIFNKGLLRN